MGQIREVVMLVKVEDLHLIHAFIMLLFFFFNNYYSWKIYLATLPNFKEIISLPGGNFIKLSVPLVQFIFQHFKNRIVYKSYN